MLKISIIRFFFYHQFFISLCAVAMTLQTALTLQLPLSGLPLYCFIFFATMLSYTAHFWLASKKSGSSQQLQWYRHYRLFTVVLMLVSLALLFISLWYVVTIWLFILIAVLLNLLYTGPLLLKSPLQLPKLFTYVKSYVIGFVWAYVSVVLPIAFFDADLFTLPVLLLFVNRFMLVSLLVLLFDYRDKLPDYEFGIHTPANAMGEKEFGTFFIVNTIIYAISVTSIALYLKEPLHFLQLLPAPLMILLQQQSKKQPSDLFYLFWVDGVMILSLLLSLFLLI